MLEVYSHGLCYASVCTDLTERLEIEVEANRQLGPTGLDHGWRISDEPTFKDGQSNPCPCNHYLDRRHFLLSCC